MQNTQVYASMLTNSIFKILTSIKTRNLSTHIANTHQITMEENGQMSTQSYKEMIQKAQQENYSCLDSLVLSLAKHRVCVEYACRLGFECSETFITRQLHIHQKGVIYIPYIDIYIQCFRLKSIASSKCYINWSITKFPMKSIMSSENIQWSQTQ